MAKSSGDVVFKKNLHFQDSLRGTLEKRWISLTPEKRGRRVCRIIIREEHKRLLALYDQHTFMHGVSCSARKKWSCKKYEPQTEKKLLYHYSLSKKLFKKFYFLFRCFYQINFQLLNFKAWVHLEMFWHHATLTKNKSTQETTWLSFQFYLAKEQRQPCLFDHVNWQGISLFKCFQKNEWSLLFVA